MPSLLRQRELLRLEYEYEKAAYRREVEASGVERRVKRGDAWFPVSVGRHYYNSLDRLVVEITRSEDEETEHNFEYGRSVCFFGMDGSGMLRFCRFAAVVSYAEEHRMVVALPDEAALSELNALERPGVALHFDETT
ncbi:MAG: helicase, partial [Bacteroidaceae bacterium]|nr:helicase [Bacteroidaceae bacterium]